MSLSQIHSLTSPMLELIEAAGFDDLHTLANADAELVLQQVDKVNAVLRMMDSKIPKEQVERWIEEARSLAPYSLEEPLQDDSVLDPIAVNYELLPEVQSLLAVAPVALPLPARLLIENQLPVSKIPIGIMLNHYCGDLDLRIEKRQLDAIQPSSSHSRSHHVPAGHFNVIQPSMDYLMNASKKNEQASLLRTPKRSTNQGIDPQSRWYIRGVLHSQPYKIYFGALITLLAMALVPSAIVSAVLLILSLEFPDSFIWVPSWLLWLPVGLPLIGILYGMIGLGGSCRVCNQKLFVHRSHLKNSKAHHIWGLGYVIPLCFQILIFLWFRCSHCGTSIRLKE